MTKAKNEKPEGPLDWEYLPIDLEKIRAALPRPVSDIEFSNHIMTLHLHINCRYLSINRMREIYQQSSENLISQINSIQETVKILIIRSKECMIIEGETDSIYDDAIASLENIIRKETINLAHFQRTVGELGDFASPMTANRANEFTDRVCGAADAIWRACHLEPNYGKRYRAFLEAVVRPVFSCDRFRHFGAVWTDGLPKRHVERLKAKIAAIASSDGNSE